MSTSTVLKIVVDNSVLDLKVINCTIRSLSKAFKDIGEQAMKEHASYKSGLVKVNSQFKIHYCTLCEKPHIHDGSWEDDLCRCDLHRLAWNESISREIQRRKHRRAVGDPRVDPSFPTLSTKSKLLRSTKFAMDFGHNAMRCILYSGCLYRLSVSPLDTLGLVEVFKQYNEKGFGDLSLCMYADILRQEFSSTGGNGTNLVDIVLKVLAANESEHQQYLRVLNDNDAFLTSGLLLYDRDLVPLVAAIHKSFWKILSLHNQGNNALFIDLLKNLPNSIGKLLTEEEHEAHLAIDPDLIQKILRKLQRPSFGCPCTADIRKTTSLQQTNSRATPRCVRMAM